MSRRSALVLAAAVLICTAALSLWGPRPTPAPSGHLSAFSSSTTGPQYLKLRYDLAATLHNAVTSLPVPSGGNGGGALTSWANGTFGGAFVDGVVLITASGTTTLTGPVGLYGGLTSTGQEYLLGKLNNGSDIAMTSTAGYAEKVSFVGSFDYLAIGGIGATITPSGGANVTVKAAPIQF